MNRREFFKSSSLFMLGLSFGGLFKSVAALAGDTVPAGKTACSDADPVAAALNYKPVAKDVDHKKFKQLKKDSLCKNCALFTPISGGFGQCTMITNCVVLEKGLCGSWQPKAKAKKA